MSDKKPNVIPTQAEIDAARNKVFTQEEMIAAANYTADHTVEEVEVMGQVSFTEAQAAEAMRQKREQEKIAKQQGQKIISEKFLREEAKINPEEESDGVIREVVREQVNQSIDYTQFDTKYNPDSRYITDEQRHQAAVVEAKMYGGTIPEPPRQPQPTKRVQQPINPNVSYDKIPLPSKGLIYPHKKGKIDVAHLTAADENILTSPNLINNGDYKEILLNRKILDVDFNYRDLHPGDRDAILIWLRSTGYGHIYPVKLIDPATENEFQTNIDLSKLKYKSLGATPDEEGLFTFHAQKANKYIKFKFLTVGDVDDFTKQLEKEREDKNVNSYNTMITSQMEKMIVEIDGERNPVYLKDMIANLPALDAYQFRKYAGEIESGIDLSVSIRTPGGVSIESFLTFGIDFFWPEGF